MRRGRWASLAVVVRMLLLALAAGGVLFAFVLDRPESPTPVSLHAGYACPMHPEVRTSAPGNCPICGMALTLLPDSRTLAPSGAPLAPTPSGATDVARQRIVTHQLHAPAWVGRDGSIQAVVYDDDLVTLVAGEAALFRPTGAPATTTVVRLADRPSVAWDASTSKVEFRSSLSGAGALAPGTVGWVESPARARAALVIPAAAVLESSDGPHVLALAADGKSVIPRPVKLGRSPFGLAVVVSGLRENERIAVRSAFFLDADRRLAAGEEPTDR
jgi:hypothetical protein